MSVAFDHRDPGTAEADWEAARLWARATPLREAATRLVVLAAHPDDETLGAGGLIASAAAAGTDVSVIVATDGEASHPASSVGGDLGTRRRLEVVAALRDLAPGARLRFLGLPDGGLRESTTALRDALLRELGPLPHGVLLAVPWWGDGHRDHRVAGEVALTLRGPGVHVVGYPIWLWHWGDPAAIDAVVEPARWRMLPLTPAVSDAKSGALARHVSQVTRQSDADGEEAILHDGMQAHFARRYELFIDTENSPAGGSADPERFDGYFRAQADPWGFETSWYEERKRSVLLAALPRQRFTRVLELGCATGVLTRELSHRADSVLGVDASPAALIRSRERAVGLDGVFFEHRTLPADWPEGSFDLVVLSELGYYWSAEDLASAQERIAASLTREGVLVACHWRHPMSDAPLTGDHVHAALSDDPSWTKTLHHLERDFVLEVFERVAGGERSA
ncbi:PIG-L family deacetylase [Microbacterium sp. NPDC056044]|uniref:PIG-L family deacetylase n=1 Tax=Microbacterium sp. NPDC056044 TaxID=3345690 RepID=UPI0035D8740E